MDHAQLRISLITLGDPDTPTGGYLYHRRMAEAAPAHAAEIRFVSVPDRRFPLPALHGRAIVASSLEGLADVVLIDSIAAAFVAPALRRDTPVPVAAILHQPPGGIDHGWVRTRLQARLDLLAYRKAGTLLVASEALRDDLAAQGFPTERIRVVPPGRDVAPAPTEPPPDLRHGRRAALLCVGNWIPRKGVLELVDAFARLPEETATLHLVGDQHLSTRYGRRVLDRVLEINDMPGERAPRVLVHGHVPRERVAQLYAGADVFVLASTKEPYGTVYGEAMALGLPVVGWDAGNLRYHATDGRDGILVPPGDVHGLTSALKGLADDAPKRVEMSRRAKERATSLPRWDETAAMFFDALRDAAREPRASAD